jgi:antitoxin MazE
MTTTVRIKKWGNDAAVRIPAKMLAEAGFEIDKTVELRQSRGRLIIEPIGETHFDLQSLLDGIRKDNLHDPVDNGPPLGREAW